MRANPRSKAEVLAQLVRQARRRQLAVEIAAGLLLARELRRQVAGLWAQARQAPLS